MLSRELIPTVLVPWLAATAAAVVAEAWWGATVLVSMATLSTTLGGCWQVLHARGRQRARGQAAIAAVQKREAQALHASGVLHGELTQLRQEVIDPRTDARRGRLRKLGIATELGIGDRRIPVRLRDLSLNDVWVELPRSEAEHWVPGLPARVTVQVDGSAEILGWAVADRSLRLPAGSSPTWRLRWRDPLREDELPRTLWRAMMDREAHRVSPHPDTRAWLHTDEGPRPALISNISATGIGLTLPLGLREAGRLHRRVQVALQLPEDDEPVVLACELVHLDVRTSGTAVGLRLDRTDPGFAEGQPRLAAHVVRRDTRDRIRLVS